MNITVADLNNLLWGARSEGYEDGLRDSQINSQFAQGQVGNTVNTQEYTKADPEPEPETCTDCGVELTEDDFAFEQYSDAFDDGYSEAIADVKESLEF
jgi:hypothetical protein